MSVPLVLFRSWWVTEMDSMRGSAPLAEQIAVLHFMLLGAGLGIRSESNVGYPDLV